MEKRKIYFEQKSLDTQGTTSTLKSITVSERKLAPQPEPVTFPKNEVSQVLHGNSESNGGFKPKLEAEFIAVSEGN